MVPSTGGGASSMMTMIMPKKGWLTGVRIRLGVGSPRADRSDTESFGMDAHQRLGILAFEVARTMSRLVALRRALSDEAITKLRSATMRREGVSYLNSSDQLLLNRVACAELVEDLDHSVAAICRLSDRCRLVRPRSFDEVYSAIKSGSGDFVLGFPSKELDSKIKKMERYIASTSALHEEMEALAELEASERNLERWRNYSGPLTAGGGGCAPAATAPQADPPGADLLMRKLAAQKRVVRKLKEESLWWRGYEKLADLMSRTVVTLFARICSIFAAVVTDLPLVVFERDSRFRFAVNRRHQNPHQLYYSGPLERPAAQKTFIRNSGPISRPSEPSHEAKPWTTQFLEPPAGTVGESGLALRYADVVVMAEEMLLSPESAGKDARKELYQMLPNALRAAVKAKLRSTRVAKAESDEAMAEGWSEAAGRILQWLGPMAHDTVRWHSERSCERQRFEPAQSKVLLLQTLHFADREKAEAAIVEVLVGLSCMYRYQRRVFARNCKDEEEEDSD